MPDATTANLALPLLQAAQAQKHVTHNEALVGLDTLVQLAVLDKDLTAPPAGPAEGDRYLIAGASPTGAWSGWAGRVVRYQDGAWRSFVPRPGWLAFVADEADLYTYAGGAWASFRTTLTAFQNLTRLGLGTTADATNPFAAKLNKALWTALTTGEGGTGDLRYTLNKQAPGNTLSLLLQTAFSGRAEIGLTGDDDLRLKVSADGSTWREALRVDRSTGGLDLAAAEASAAVAATVDLGGLPSLKVALTGTGTVTSFGTVPNRLRLLRFTGAATLTHNATSLILPGGATLVTAAGDTAVATSDGSGNWRVVDYVRASGKPLAGPAAAEITDAGATGRAVLTAADAGAAAGALGLGPSFRNRLRNAAFAINQRARSGTVTLAAGAYGHDGVKAGASGATYTFAVSGLDTALTISAGSLVLPIEAAMIEGGIYTLSHAGTAQARVWQGGGAAGSGSYAACPLTVAGLSATTQTNVEFSAGTVLRPQFEPGTASTVFERRPIDVELALCQRYFETNYKTGVAPGSAVNINPDMCQYAHPSGGFGQYITFNVRKRAAPSLTLYDANGASGKVTYYTSTWNNGGDISAVGMSEVGIYVQSNISGAMQTALMFAVTAEI